MRKRLGPLGSGFCGRAQARKVIGDICKISNREVLTLETIRGFFERWVERIDPEIGIVLLVVCQAIHTPYEGTLNTAKYTQYAYYRILGAPVNPPLKSLVQDHQMRCALGSMEEIARRPQVFRERLAAAPRRIRELHDETLEGTKNRKY